MAHRRAIWTAAICALATLAAGRAFAGKPAETFRTLHTAHFRITYPEPYRFFALRTAIVAEDAFDLLTARLKWTPSTPIEIVLTDRTDSANGSSTVAPVQVINLFMTAPNTGDRLDYYDDWLRLLVYHEMTHSVHMDAARGIPLGFRYLFGRVLPIGSFQPQGLIEGQAVMQETALSTKGRNRAPNSWMLLRTAALDDNWPTIDQLTLTPHVYPTGAVPYIWGGMFHQFLVDRYGMEKMADFNLKHAGQIWPFLFNHNARVIFGTHLDDLYEEFTVDMKRRFAAERDRIAAAGLTPAVRLTAEGWDHSSPRWLADGRLVYAESTRDRGATLRALDPRDPGKGSRRLATLDSGTRGILVKPDGEIVFAQVSPEEPWRTFYDLWRLPPGAWLPRRVTLNQRVADAALVPGAERAIAIATEGGANRLVEIDLRVGAATPLTEYGQFGGFIQISGVAIHPSGTWAVVSIWHEDGNRDLFKFELATRAFTRLTADPQRDLDPAFDPSGRYLLFSSGRDGVYNLYALDLQTDELFRVTNVLGGAFEPAVDPTGKRLAFVGCNGFGFDLYLMDFDPAQWRKVEREQPEPNAVVIGRITHDIDVRAAALDPPTDDYNPARTVWPHYWLPDFAFGSDDFLLGAETTGRDVLDRHAWNAHALWAFNREFLYADAAYAYARWRPVFTLHAAHVAQDHGDILHDRDRDRTAGYWERRVAGEAFVHYPLFLRHGVYLGYVGQWRSDLDEPPRWTDSPPFAGYWSGAQAGWSYATGEALDRQIRFPAALGGTLYAPALGSDVEQELIGAQASAYFPLPIRQMGFLFSAFGGVSFGDQLAQRTFTLGGNTQANPIVLGYNNDRFALRGYSSGVAVGDAAGVGAAQYTFPVADIERGISTWPIYFRGLHGRAFAEAGFAVDRDERLRVDDLYPDVGLSLYLDYVISYFIGLTFQTSAAYGFRDRDDTGGFHWLVSLGDLLP